MPNFAQVEVSNPIDSAPDGTPIVKCTLVASQALPPGNYSFHWLAEMRVSAAAAGAYAGADVTFNGATVYRDAWPFDEWHLVSGSGSAPFDGQTPSFELRFFLIGAGTTAQMRRARLSLIQEST